MVSWGLHSSPSAFEARLFAAVRSGNFRRDVFSVDNLGNIGPAIRLMNSRKVAGHNMIFVLLLLAGEGFH